MTNPITERITKALEIIDNKDATEGQSKKTWWVKRWRVVLAIILVIYLTHHFTSQRINDELWLSRLNQLTTEVNKLSSQLDSLDKDKTEKQLQVNEAMKVLDTRKAELWKIKNEIQSKEDVVSIKKEQIKKINTAIRYVKDATKNETEGKLITTTGSSTGAFIKPTTWNNSSWS